MILEKYSIISTDDIRYKSLLNKQCDIEKRFIYVYMLEEHLQRYITTGTSIFKIGQTDVKVGNRIADQVYHHNWQTITSSAPIIISIYEVDNNITDKMIQHRICSLNNNAVISRDSEKKSYQYARPGVEWVDNITISDIENAINYYNGKFIFINNDALTNNFKIENNKENSKYEFVNMLNHLANSYDNSKERNIIRNYIQGIVICSIILGYDYKKCNILFEHKKFIDMIEKLFNISFDEFMNKISYYAGNYSDIDEMISMIHDYAKDNDLDMAWIADCFIDFTNGDNDFATNWKRMSAYYYADYLQEYIDKMDFDCKKNKDVKFLIYPGSLAILDMIAEYRKIAIGKYNRKSEKICHIIENEMTLAFDYNDEFIANFVKQIIYYKYNIKFDNIIFINEKQVIYNNKKELIDMPKFDYIVQNPPYSGDLHLDFLEMGMNMLNDDGQMVIIEPATWLINLRDNGNVKKYNEIKNSITGNVKSVTIASLNGKFNTGLYVPFSIMHIDKSNNHDKIFFTCYDDGKFVNSLYDCNLIGDNNMINTIKNKIVNGCKEMCNDYIFNPRHAYNDNTAFLRYVPIMTLHPYKNNSADAIYDDVNNMTFNQSYMVYGAHKYDNIPVKRDNIGVTGRNNIWACIYCDKFDNFEDNKKFLENFVDFTRHTKFAHYLGIVYIINQNNTVLPYVPYLDFSHKWTDEMLYKFFDLSDDEIELIESACDKFEWHSDWYKKFREYED